MSHVFLRLAVVLALSLPALSVAVDETPLKDPALEARARTVMKDIRCLVCQNQSIEDSNADLARDLRQIVREQVAAGKTDGEIRAYLVARYGDWVLLKPPFDMRTAFLWMSPLLFLGLAVLLLIRRDRAHGAGAIPPGPDLSAEERARLDSLLETAPDTPRDGHLERE